MASNKDRAKYVRRIQSRELETQLIDSFGWLYGLNDKLVEGSTPKIDNGAFKDLDELLERCESFKNPTFGIQVWYMGVKTLYREVRKYYDKFNKSGKPQEEPLGLQVPA